MKKNLVSLNQKFNQQSERIGELELEMDRLKTDNLKLVTDMKILRNEN